MSGKNQEGFSLIELLVVFVIIGILVTMTYPSMRKARDAAENGNAAATMRTIVSAQYSYYTQKGRYARLDELNDWQYGTFGKVLAPGVLYRGNLTYQMSPNPTPLDGDLKENFTVKATRPGSNGEPPYVITVDQSGEVVQIF